MLQEFVTSSLGLTVIMIIILIALLSGVGYLKAHMGERMNTRNTTLALAFSAVIIGLATALSFFTLFTMPQGGSVTLLSMFLVSLIGYFYGPVQGILCGISYGFLQLIVNPYVIHPVQMILDYPLAFGMLGISGFFYQKRHGLIVGYLAGVLGRLICSVLSGVVFFSDNAQGKGMTPLIYSIVYNGSFMGAEAVITCVLLCLEPIRNAITSVRRMVISEV